MPAEFTGCTLKENTGTLYGKRRHGIGLRARRIKGTRIRESGNAHVPFDFRVVGLEIRVSDGPIGECGSWNCTNLAALDKVNLVKTPEVCREMHAGPANTPAVDERALRFGFFVGRFSESSWL